jgi:hypothetical protein
LKYFRLVALIQQHDLYQPALQKVKQYGPGFKLTAEKPPGQEK